jgi:hypothetical protein
MAIYNTYEITIVTEDKTPLAVNGAATGAGCIPTEANVESPPCQTDT